MSFAVSEVVAKRQVLRGHRGGGARMLRELLISGISVFSVVRFLTIPTDQEGGENA
jgi:hypothetical protein